MTEEQQWFLDRIKAAAVHSAEPQGVPAAVSLAQAILESGWGRSGLARKANALHGIKARGGWTGPVYSGTTREAIPGGSIVIRGKNRVYPSKSAALADGCAEGAIFRAYASFEESVEDHARFFHKNPRYYGALRAYQERRDPFEFATLIWKAGYATARDYGPNLHNYMRRYAADLLPGGVPPMPRELPKLPVVFVDGREIPSTAIRIVDGRLYLHARLVFEALGYGVDYNGETKVVTIRKGDR